MLRIYCTLRARGHTSYGVLVEAVHNVRKDSIARGDVERDVDACPWGIDCLDGCKEGRTEARRVGEHGPLEEGPEGVRLHSTTGGQSFPTALRKFATAASAAFHAARISMALKVVD